jgi:hypothetical protein
MEKSEVKTEGNIAGTTVVFIDFWRQLLNKAKDLKLAFADRTPSKINWIDLGSEVKGFSFTFVIRSKEAEVVLGIHQGDWNKNKKFFDELFSNREQIENIFGYPLKWQRLNTNSESHIRYTIKGLGLSDHEKWSELQLKMINAMIQFQAALLPEIKKLN